MMFLLSAMILTLMTIHHVHGVPLSEFFNYGTSAGDTTLPKEDDGEFDLNFEVPFLFYNKSFTKIIVSTNGVMSFTEGTSYIPTAFPRSNGISIVAPFWGDVDTESGLGDIYVRFSTSDTITINAVKSLVGTHYWQDFRNFVATGIIVVTWFNVSYYSKEDSTGKTNTFQCVLASDGRNTFAIFLYLDDGINWTAGDTSLGATGGLGGSTPAQAGFDAGNGVTFTAIEGSLTDDIINIEEKSNVGVAGLFIFQINGGFIRAPSEACPVFGSNSCYERIKRSGCQHLNRSIGNNELPASCQGRL